MTISTNNINKVNSGIKSTVQKEQKNAKDLFADIMSMASMGGSMKEMSNEAGRTISVSEKTASSAADYGYTGKVNASDKTDSFTSGQKDLDKDVKWSESKTDTKSYDKANASSKTDNSRNTNDTQDAGLAAEDVTDDEITEDAKAVVSSMLKQLIDLLTNDLGISEENLNLSLDGMGMGVGDLLDPEMLKSFILNINDATDVNLLIDENLVNMITDLSEDLSVLSDDANRLLSELGEQNLNLANLVNELANGELTVSEEIIWAEEETSVYTLGENISHNAVKENGGDDKAQEALNTAQNNQDEVTYTPLNADNNIGNNSNADEAFDFSKWSSSETDSRADDSLNMNFAQAVGQAFQNTDISMVSEASEIDGFDIVRQIVDDIKAHVTKETTALEVHLNPENLGKVTITVSEKDGALQAKIIAETEAAKNAIETGLANLKEAFENQELKVEAIEVMVGMQDFLQSNEDNQTENEADAKNTETKSAINLDDGLEEDELDDEQKLQVEMMRMAGNRVNYSI